MIKHVRESVHLDVLYVYKFYTYNIILNEVFFSMNARVPIYYVPVAPLPHV